MPKAGAAGAHPYEKTINRGVGAKSSLSALVDVGPSKNKIK